MTTVYVHTDSLGKISGVFAMPVIGATPMDDQMPAVQKFLRDPMGLEDAFPVLLKWQFWLAGLEVGVTKSSVYQAIASMPIPEPEKEAIRIMVEDVNQYRREDPRINLLASAMGITSEQLDSLWHWAALMEPPPVD